MTGILIFASLFFVTNSFSQKVSLNRTVLTTNDEAVNNVSISTKNLKVFLRQTKTAVLKLPIVFGAKATFQSLNPALHVSQPSIATKC